MDFLSTPPSRHRKIALWAIGVGLILYTILLIKNVGASAGGSDSSGYMNHARLLAGGNLHAPPRALEDLPPAKLPSYAYVPLGFSPTPGTGDLVPTYPPGLPLMVLAAHALVGWKSAGDLVMVLNSLAGIVVTFLLARRLGVPQAWAAVAALIVATSPVYLYMSLQAMSDVPSLFWVGLAILSALKSQEKAAWSFLAGAAFSVAVLLRPTNTLMIIPVGIALGLSPKRWICLGLAGIPGAIYWMLYAKAAYGSAFTTGYGDVGSAFLASSIGITLVAYAKWIPSMFTPVALLFVALPWLNPGRTRENSLLVSWAIICPIFYVSYYCTHETWWYERFLLPSLPAMLIGGLIVVRALATKWLQRPSARFGWAAVGLILLNNAAWGYRFEAENIGRGERNYSHLAEWMNANLPPDSIVAVMQDSGAVYYYTDFKLVRWDMLEEGNAFQKIAASARAHHHPLYAVLFPFEVEERHALTHYMPGPWKSFGKVRGIGVYQYDFTAPLPAAKP